MLQGGKLFRRDIIEEKQLYFPKQVVYGEDIRFNMQYFKYVNRYIVSDFPLFIYNIRQKYCYNTVTNPPKEVHVYAVSDKSTMCCDRRNAELLLL